MCRDSIQCGTPTPSHTSYVREWFSRCQRIEKIFWSTCRTIVDSREDEAEKKACNLVSASWTAHDWLFSLKSGFVRRHAWAAVNDQRV